MYSCAQCELQACSEEEGKNPSKSCPMNSPCMQFALAKYSEEDHDFYISASEIEALGYGNWTRVKETVQICKMMGYHRVGLAFCRGLRKEAKIMDNILRRNGFEVVSVICKTGGIPKEQIGIPPEFKVHPEQFEPMCNPIAQALLLNEQETEFNIALGLCVGHDSMFYKYSKALTTTLVAKDRALAHNPAAALYCSEGYFKKRVD